MNLLRLFKRNRPAPIKVGSECHVLYATTHDDTGLTSVTEEPCIVRKLFKNGRISVYLYRLDLLIRVDKDALKP